MRTLALLLCTWVLWTYTIRPNSMSVIPVSGFDTKELCEQAGADLIKRLASDSAPTYRHTCLPDTVDPRRQRR